VAEQIQRLIEVMDTLRSPGGCPWDAEQTHQSLARYLLEETYETLEAMDRGDLVALREELGDLLLQIVFHARIAQETDPSFTVDAVAGNTAEKLVRRHPHVFAGVTVTDDRQLEDNWAAIKAAEKPRDSVTDGVPAAMPALQVATQLSYRARKLAAPVSDGQLREQLRPLLGDISDAIVAEALVAIVELARERDIDAESVLRRRMAQYRSEIRAVEGLG
jgi:XTP/dITP diphosphohydrolase